MNNNPINNQIASNYSIKSQYAMLQARRANWTTQRKQQIQQIRYRMMVGPPTTN